MKEKVYRWIDENEGEVVKLLQELIRIPSVNPYFDEDKQYMQEGKAQAYLKEYLEVAPTAGITTLAKFLFEKKLFLTKSNKPIATNTIRGELTDLLKDMNCANPRGKQNKK